jgi:hypothetical protein
MNKIKLLARGFDGVTLVEQAPTFQLVDGWTQASLSHPAGVLPAGLWGQVPAGDPYLLHINVLTSAPLAAGYLFELQSGPPVQPRVQYWPAPSNLRVVLVRPTDRLRLVVAEQAEVKVELLIESIGGVNELGSRMFDWARTAQTGIPRGATTATIDGPVAPPAWTGMLHIIHDSKDADTILLPPLGLMPLDSMLTLTKRGIGTPLLKAGPGDTLSGGLASFPVTRTVVVYNNGDEWAFVGA